MKITFTFILYSVFVMVGCGGQGNEFTNEVESIFDQMAENIKGSVDSIGPSNTESDFIETIKISEDFSKTVAEKTLEATVAIVVYEDGTPIGIGSGVVVGKEKIITNYHVIDDANGGFVQITNDEREYAITDVLALSKKNDLALLTVSGFDYTPIKISSSKHKIGDKIYAAGNPKGLSGTFSEGIISAFREFEGRELIQLTAPISPGSSGGPIVNENGELIGIAVGSITEGQNLNFAIPVKYVEELIKQGEKKLPKFSQD